MNANAKRNPLSAAIESARSELADWGEIQLSYAIEVGGGGGALGDAFRIYLDLKEALAKAEKEAMA